MLSRHALFFLCASGLAVGARELRAAPTSARFQSAQASQQDAGGASDSLTATPRKTGRKSKLSRRRSSRSNVSRGEIASKAAAPLWTSPRGVESLESDLRSALTQHTRRGQWGVMIVSLTRGDTLFRESPDAMMQPASTMKMYTSVLALDRFGPEYQFKTAALHDGVLNPDGLLAGNLYLRGSGDPSLSPRFWGTTNPMDSLAQLILARGVRHIHGDIVGDASAFDPQLVPEGWQTRYLGAAYAARVSALSLNENLVWVVVQADGKKAVVTLDPATTTIPVQSTVRVVGGSGGRISAVRQKDGSILVRGSIGSSAPPQRYSLVVDDPASFTTGALRAALEKAGVTVDGRVTVGTTPGTATELASISSPTLANIIAEMNRESINLYAELLFRDAAHAAAPDQVGSAQTGLATLRSLLSAKVAARPEDVQVSDGSGLSVLDRVTPRSMVELLSFAHQAPWGATFHASLPLEGESGTLRHRARHTPARGNLHAKTGTTNTVASLGGYVTAKNGEILAFSFIYNGSDRWNAKLAMDQMGATLAEFVR
ncbi:MAG TPA: D-alanyl-D-alanine carboxypeptidase/D-alanyl-D-alanine-endopeptidase [Gemmatimonadaceae bacterium]|jgi:D-alanyl-D-alanine carboxypeptidase/D-alanyl-D-alanine-endopeptidase (penicillin-binding protein 4)